MFAGHGIEYSDGHQTLLTNEYDKKSKSYKRFCAEKMVRILSDHNKNSYHIGIFACCRQAFKTYDYKSREDVDAYNIE